MSRAGLILRELASRAASCRFISEQPPLRGAAAGMAEPRKVPFVTISSFGSPPQTPEPGKKRRREDEAVDITLGKDGGGGGGGAAAVGGGGGGGLFGKEGDANKTEEEKPTLRLSLTLTEPNDRGSSEFNYGELLHTKTSPAPSQVRDSRHDTTMLTKRG